MLLLRHILIVSVAFLIFVFNFSVISLGAASRDVALYTDEMFLSDLANGNLKCIVTFTISEYRYVGKYLYLKSLTSPEFSQLLQAGVTYTWDLDSYFTADGNFYLCSPYYFQGDSGCMYQCEFSFSVIHKFQLEPAPVSLSCASDGFYDWFFGSSSSGSIKQIQPTYSIGFYDTEDRNSFRSDYIYDTLGKLTKQAVFWSNALSTSYEPFYSWMNKFHYVPLAEDASIYYLISPFYTPVSDLGVVYGYDYGLYWRTGDYVYSQASNDNSQAFYNSPFFVMIPRISYYTDSFVEIPGDGGGAGSTEPSPPSDSDSNTQGNPSSPDEMNNSLGDLQGILDDMEKADVPPLDDFNDSLVSSEGMADVFRILSPITSLPVFGIGFSLIFGLIAAKLLLYGVR